MANPVMWFEIIGKDSVGLQSFYRDVFGWKLTPPVKEMGNYSMVEGHEPGPGGGIGEGDPRVTVYIETQDPQSLLEKAARAGARVLMPVTTVTPTTTIAMLVDPAGNTFGLMKANPRPARPARPQRRSTDRPRARTKTAAKRGRKTAKKSGARKATARKRTKRR